VLLFWTLVIVLPYAARGRDRHCPGRKKKMRYAKIWTGIRDQLPMSSCAVVTQDIRLPDPWKRFVPESPGRLRHAARQKPLWKSQIYGATCAESKKSEYANTPVALSIKSFRSEFQLWVHICPRGFAFSWTRVGETDSTRLKILGHGARWKPGKLSPGQTRARALRRRGQRKLKVVFLRARAVGVRRPSRENLTKWRRKR
jgi:hypothetical protein